MAVLVAAVILIAFALTVRFAGTSKAAWFFGGFLAGRRGRRR
jgi:hypothetical protein